MNLFFTKSINKTFESLLNYSVNRYIFILKKTSFFYNKILDNFWPYSVSVKNVSTDYSVLDSFY